MITCEFEDGGKARLRHATVNAIVYNKKNQLLLVKRSPHLTNGDKWSLPGGFLDRDENTKEGILRELAEETQVDGHVKFLFMIVDNPDRSKEDRQNVNFVYVIEALTHDIKIDEESSDAGWFGKEEMPKEVDFAFDHRDIVMNYFRYLNEKFELPLLV